MLYIVVLCLRFYCNCIREIIADHVFSSACSFEFSQQTVICFSFMEVDFKLWLLL